ncbi:MAG: YceI family protein [Verrucomicrobiales bacterium]|nr:YceI family protein [Verrucomicrobiales bacterium]
MKKFFAPVLCLGLLLSGCAENPADNVEKANVENVTETSEALAPASTEPAEKKIFVLANSSKINWTGSKVTGSHTGGFANFVGKFEVADSQLVPGGKHFVTVDMASVHSDNEKLTAHLKTEDFFDVEKYPIARFQLREAKLIEGNNYEISGILDMHGNAKKITFPATINISEKETLLDMAAEFSINRKDFGISYPGKPDDLIRDEVVMNFQVSAIPGEPQELVLLDKTAEAEENGRGPGRGGRDGKGRGGKGGKGDWRNMSEEEREERRKQFIAEIDKNNDGQLGKDEMPERMWNFMGRADKDGDDKLSEQERSDFRAQMAAERELREITGEGGSGFPGRRPPGGKGGRDQ